MKKPNLQLSSEKSESLKQDFVGFLKRCCQDFPSGLEQMALAPGALRTKWRPKGHMLLEPDTLVTEAHYLKSGIAILFSLDQMTGAPNVFHVWGPDMMIIMFKEFQDQLPNEEYFIILGEDAELVTMSNKCLQELYQQYPIAHEIAKSIISQKKHRMLLQMRILLMPVKTERLAAFEKTFPELRGRLSNEHLCGLLSISPATLAVSR